MPNYDSTSRQPFKEGGRAGYKKGSDVPHGLKEVKSRRTFLDSRKGINVATGQRVKPDLGGKKLPKDIAKWKRGHLIYSKAGKSAGYAWNADRTDKKGKRLESVADKGVYVHKAPTKDRKGDKTWKTRVKDKKRMEAAIAKKKRQNKEYSTKQEVKIKKEKKS